MTELQEYAENLAHELNGTCDQLDFAFERSGIPETLRDNVRFLEILDGIVFKCDRCDWWYEVCEMSNTAFTCEECEDDV